MTWLDHIRWTDLEPAHMDLEDRTYYIPCRSDLQGLVRSIRQVGILSPPLLQERSPGRFIPVIGRRRLMAARSLEFTRVHAGVLPETVLEQEGFALAFWDNIATRPFDVGATAVVVRRLLDLFPRITVADLFLPSLGVQPEGPRLERLRAIGGLEEPILAVLSAGKLLEKSAALMALLKPEERLGLLDFTESLGLNANKRAEVIERLFDLSVLHGKGVLEWITDERISAVTGNHELSVPERAAKVREIIKAWKFPELVRSEQAFGSWLARLPQPDGVVVRPSTRFEAERCKMELSGLSREEVERIIRMIGEGRPRKTGA